MHVVSVASESALPVWRFTQTALLDRIDPERITVIVPDEAVLPFRGLTDSRIAVESENLYVSDFSAELRSAIPEMNATRFGWYLQQFIKLSAILGTPPDEQIVIWDADTVPITSPTFFDVDGKPLLFKGDEHHLPYFTSVDRLLGMPRAVSHSFVAQCFPLTGSLGKSFFDYIENRHGRPWWEAIIQSVDFSAVSGFSEYETLGTYLSNLHSEDISYQSGVWLRNGWSVFTSPAQALRSDAQVVAYPYEFVAFEKWQKPSIKALFMARLYRCARWVREVFGLT